MKRVRTRSPRLVGAGSTVGPAPLQSSLRKQGRGPAVVQNVQAVKVKRCPVCNDRPAAVEVTVGPITVKICAVCSKLPTHAIGLWQAIRPFFL